MLKSAVYHASHDVWEYNFERMYVLNRRTAEMFHLGVRNEKIGWFNNGLNGNFNQLSSHVQEAYEHYVFEKELLDASDSKSSV